MTAPPLAITTASLPGGRAASAYTATLQASGGSGSNVWSVASSALPTGVTLDASTGALSGVPSVAGTFTFTLKVPDAGDASNYAIGSYSFAIAPPPPNFSSFSTGLPFGSTDPFNVNFHVNGAFGKSGKDGFAHGRRELKVGVPGGHIQRLLEPGAVFEESCRQGLEHG